MENIKKLLLIKKLLAEGKISEEEAILLEIEKEDGELKFLTPPSINPFIRFFTLFPDYDKSNYYDRCSCNPKNGGSGLCNCILSNMTIT